MGERKQLGGLLEGVSGLQASPFHPTTVEPPGRRSASLIRQELRAFTKLESGLRFVRAFADSSPD